GPCNPLHHRTLLSVRPLWHRHHVGHVMVKTPVAFEFSKTRTICDAFDDAWALLQGLGSDLTQAPKSLATQTILAKRIIEMADQGLRDIPMHCTGKPFYEILKAEVPKKVIRSYMGTKPQVGRRRAAAPAVFGRTDRRRRVPPRVRAPERRRRWSPLRGGCG